MQTFDWTQQDPKMSLAAGATPAALFVQAIMANCTERSFIMSEILIVLKEFFFLYYYCYFRFEADRPAAPLRQNLRSFYLLLSACTLIYSKNEKNVGGSWYLWIYGREFQFFSLSSPDVEENHLQTGLLSFCLTSF